MLAGVSRSPAEACVLKWIIDFPTALFLKLLKTAVLLSNAIIIAIVNVIDFY